MKNKKNIEDYIEKLSGDVTNIIMQAHIDTLIDGRSRAILVEEVNDEIEIKVVFTDLLSENDLTS